MPGDSSDGGDDDDSTTDNESDAELDALLDALQLKDERRTGWQLRGIDDPESVAAHSWGVAYLCLTLGDRFRADLPDLDLDRALRLAVVHDVAEAETGDVATRADSTVDTADAPDAEEKEALEREAMAALAGPLPDHLRDAWEEYEARETPEAILVKELDLVEMCLQALFYERRDRYEPSEGEPAAFQEYEALDEFFATAAPRLRTPTGKALVAGIRERYEAARGNGE
ncbi:MAG: HD family hydrolase [Halopenitus sp.]